MKQSIKDNSILIGRFGKVFGIKGYIKVHSFTHPIDNILNYKNWFILKDNQQVDIAFEDILKRTPVLVVKIKGCDSIDSAQNLVNLSIYIDKSELPDLVNNEHYWHELINMEVFNECGAALGKVIEIIPTGSNDVLVVQGKKRLLIPYVPEVYVKAVNQQNKQIMVAWDFND